MKHIMYLNHETVSYNVFEPLNIVNGLVITVGSSFV